MSKRTERREAERAARRLAFLERRQSAATPDQPNSPEPTAVETEPTDSNISEAQLAANRANAQLSTGPTTEEGKAKSSMNALKHGLTGKTVLLPTDDSAEYERKLQARIDALKPATDEELTLVQSMVDAAWRLSRIQSLETGIMLKGQIEFASKFEDQSPARRAQLIDVEAYLKYEKSIRNLQIQEARLHRRLEKDQAELTRLQTIRKREELLASQANPIPAAQPNGFEFSTPNLQHPVNSNHNRKARHGSAG